MSNGIDTIHIESRYRIYQKGDQKLNIILICDHASGRASLLTEQCRSEFVFKDSTHEMMKGISELIDVAAGICKNTGQPS